MILATTVTQGPDACHTASSVAPSFPPLWPDPSLFLPDLPLPCIPLGPPLSGAPSSMPQDQQAQLAQGAWGRGLAAAHREIQPVVLLALSPVLIIAAPGGIVPYYYMVDLYLIRHHLKPSAPSWHPCSPTIPPASTCPSLYYSCINQVTVSGQNQRKAP